MKFLVAYKKGNKTLVKIVLDDGQEVWATTTDAVYNWAKKSFKEKEEVDVEYTVKNGQYAVSRITKKGQGGRTTETEQETSEFTCEDCGASLKDDKYKKCFNCNQAKRTGAKSSEYTCADCGASLKDGKYKKCFTCNQKNPVKSTGTYSKKTPEATELIKREAVAHATSRVIIGLQGHIDPNNVHEIFTQIFQTILDLVERK